ncbi:MAG: hypothetical protein AAF211_21845, partial [Myxococcota bacterium]
MDLFESPQTPRVAEEVSVAAAVSDAVSGLVRNAGPWLAVLVAEFVLSLLGFVTLLGWVVVWPILYWGMQAFALRAIDGPAPFRALFDGTKNLETTMSRMWGLSIIAGVAYLMLSIVPSIAIGFPELLALAEGGELGDVVPAVKARIVDLLVLLLLVRFELVLPLIVERGKPVLESITESWRLTAPHWPTLVGILLLHTLLSLPSLVLGIGMGRMIPDDFDLGVITQNLSALSGGYLGMLVTSTFANVFYLMCMTSVFRRLLGPAPPR